MKLSPRATTQVALVLAALTTAVPFAAVHGQDVSLKPDTLETPRTLALGTGVRASSASTAALANNPSALPYSRQYHLEAISGYSPSPARWTLGSAVVDSNTTSLAAGLSARTILSAGDNSYSGYDLRVAGGLPFGENISIGVAGRYLSIQGDQREGDLAEGFTLDAALTVQPFPGLRIAALGYNLIEIKEPEDLSKSNLAPRTVGGSVAYTGEQGYSLGADVLYDLDTFQNGHFLIGGGAEYFAAGKVPIRLGYSYDGGRQIHTISGGGGYVDPKFGVEFAVRQDVGGDNDTVFLLSARYFVQ